MITYNTNTVAGAASAGPQAFARVLTGFNYHGPDGQIVGDHDFGTISVVGRAPLVLDYEISASAVYSDGKPITCDDMVLAWASQSGRFPGFDAANRAGYSDIASVDCAPGQKKARVSFAADRAFVDFGQLFAATSMMPSHVIADALGLGDGGVTTALLNNDGPSVERIAQVWNNTWNLTPDLDLKKFPSSGPYKLESVTKDGAVVLVANDKWWGAKPVTNKITVWPAGADIQDRVNEGAYDVVDIATGSSGTLNLPDDYVRTDSPSAGIEQLIFAPRGPMAAPPARRALALCTPRDLIARNAAVPIANARLNPATEDALSPAEVTVEAGQFTAANPERRPRRDQQPAAAGAHRISEPERPAGRDGRHDRQGLCARRHHRAGQGFGDRRPTVVAQQRDRRADRQHRRRRRQRVHRRVGDGRLRPAHRQRQQPVGLLERTDRRNHRHDGRHRRSEGTVPAARRRRTDPVGRHADASALPAAADIADFEEDVCGGQQSDSMGRGVEHGSLGAGPVSDPTGAAGPATSGTDISRLIASLMREVPDFPEPGIQFKDLTPLLADAKGLAAVTDALADIAKGADLVAGIDARGFLLGAAVAIKLQTGVLAVRKGGKLPPPVHSETYALEYGTATLEIPADGIDLAGRSIAIIDDVLATGGTVAAAARLLRHAGATVTGAAVVLELAALGGRDVLKGLPVSSLHTV